MKSDRIIIVTMSLALICAVPGIFVPYFVLNVVTATFILASGFFFLTRKPEKEVIIKEVIIEKEEEKEEVETQVKDHWKIDEILNKITPASGIKQPAKDLFEILSDRLELVQGCLYTVGHEPDGTQMINVTYSYAYYSPERLEKFEWGEGLVGASIADKQPIHLKNLPAGYITITSGLGESKSGELLIIPLIEGDKSFGALELAFFKPLTDQQVTQLKTLSVRFLEKIQSTEKEELA